ncbi:MAG: hypothetical protein HQK75_05745 [Candidatus Magnetomorum sp.]|nr:hypothetical protein [Candidatus Magnetomorum sp.]
MYKKIKSPKTPWHNWFGNLFKVSLIPTGLEVETDVPVMNQLPEADIVIIRRQTNKWTNTQLQRLPDGIRHTRAACVLLELKYSESINVEAILQIGGYYKFYKHSHNLNQINSLKCFLISSKTPQKKTLNRFRYKPTRYSGVYKSSCPICRLFPIISLNDLSDAPYNLLFKLFASKKQASSNATKKLKTDLYGTFPYHLKCFISGFIYKCLIKGGKDMDWLNLTPKDMQSLKKEWLSTLYDSCTPSEVLSNYSPSEVLSNYSPSEVLSNFTPENFLAGLNSEQLNAISRILNK